MTLIVKMRIYFIKKTLLNAKNNIWDGIGQQHIREGYMLFFIITIRGRSGFIVSVENDEIIVNFGCSQELEAIKYNKLKNSNLKVTYSNQFESFYYNNIYTYYLFNRDLIIKFRMFFRKIKNKRLIALSLKKTKLHIVVEKLVDKACTQNRKICIDENDLLEMFNPHLKMLSYKDRLRIENFDKTHAYYDLILKALAESGNVESEGMYYVIKPKILLTYQNMESERKKHIQVIIVTGIAAIASGIAAIASVYSAIYS